MRAPRFSVIRERPPEAWFDGFSKKLTNYLSPAEVEEIRRAFLYAQEAHRYQSRLSGEPYITHPLAVAYILAGMSFDVQTLEAALLHDVIEDTPVERAEIAELFGEEVALLVDGVSKLTQIRFETRQEAQAENFRKMVLAMVADVRVILIKLADRLHNMRTLEVMPPAKRRRIARETLEIYAPIAHRLGMRKIRLELEDLGFRALYPDRYQVLMRSLKRNYGQSPRAIPKIIKHLQEECDHSGLEVRISGRNKAVYSIYRKMRDKGAKLSEISDIHGIRMVTTETGACYRVLGIVHGTYKPVPGRFKDYIAIPKDNGYQSLHTVIVGPNGIPVEVQIRTEAMKRVAENGIAAHWMYKTGQGAATDEIRTREWLRNLEKIRAETPSPVEFLEHAKVDLVPGEIYVFTPKGKIIALPQGATPVDFAYAVHTEVGNSCVSAKINQRIVPLRMPLEAGQTVQIITARRAQPNPAWLNFVVTAKARSTLRRYLRDRSERDSVRLGRRMLEQALGLHRGGLRWRRSALDEAADRLKTGNRYELLRRIGSGEFPAPLVAGHFLEEGGEMAPPGDPIEIRGTTGFATTLSPCCHPIPGDRIAGLLTRGKGLMIHRIDCRNLAAQKEQDRIVDVAFEPNAKSEYVVELKLDVDNQLGVLARVAATVANAGSNILHAQIHEYEDRTSSTVLEITVRDRRHLAGIIRHLRKMPAVLRIMRS